MRPVSQFFAVLIAIPFTLTCLRTDPGTVPRTTTVVSITTTARPRTTTTRPRTTTTTTVAPILACQTCQASQVSFDEANGDAGRIDSSFRLETPDPASGCLRLTAICTAQTGYFSFMEFNVVEGGPAENQDMGQITEALLECIDGAWYYRRERLVNSVQCTEAPL